MYDDIDSASPFDFDDLDLPDPESEEDVSEEPTAVASTAELLAAVALRMQANQSIGHVDLGDADVIAGAVKVENTNPTLAHQPVPPPPEGEPVAPAAALAPAAEGEGLGALMLLVLLITGALALAAFLAMQSAT